NILEPSGSKTCNKLSMKVKINWDDPKGEFYGLRKLQFHSMRLDPTQMHDRLGYWLFGEMGVPAPRAVHARLLINGEFSGLYSLVEQIDGRFTREVFDDGSGNLYKEVWPIDIDGAAQTEKAYLKGLKTNEDNDPSVALIRSFATEIVESKGGDADSARQLITKWMDLDEVMAYLVVDRTIRHDDGPLHFYCLSEGGCANHNFYWYENPSDSTLHLIPWDLDNAFENIVADANPVTPIADDFGEVSADCAFYSYGSFQLEQRSAVCDPLFSALAQLDSEYERVLADFLAGPFAVERVDVLLDEWQAQIADATAEAAQLYPDALDPGAWTTALERFRSSLEHARSN
ncbi:MAG: CotH kinase family protein, partial [Acidimicrobiales bacterium]